MKKKSNVTIDQVAMKADVSKTTVSFYLNGRFEKMSAETKARIERVINETGYSPSTVARSLKIKRTNLIGVIVTDISNPFSSLIVKGIDDIARKNNYQIIVGSTNFEKKLEETYIQQMFDIRVDGFIIQPTMKSNRTIQSLVDDGRNIVLLDSVFEEFKGAFVKTNNYDVTNRAIKELIEKGYEDFIFISEDIELLGPRIERAKSFCDILERHELPYSIQTIRSPINKDEIKDKLDKNIDFSKKTLLFGSNGLILQNIFKIAKENQWTVPNPIGIIGFDDWGWQELTHPTVSAIAQPTYEEGKKAIEFLIQMIDNKMYGNKIEILPCNINWRQSTNL
ncbi:MAG TPA: LacI family DNA-binding transcriptional regulator [Tissierellales bacterium]|nr:LacI family DNA-binding transcriptional regulator [Tissierellales bacterium]